MDPTDLVSALLAALAGTSLAPYLTYLPDVFLACALAAAVLPHATADSPAWWRALRGALDLGAVNFWKAKNAGPALSGVSSIAHQIGALVLLPVLLLGLSACSAAQRAETVTVAKATGATAGQLYCAVHTVSGPIVVALINAEASAAAPTLAPIAVVASGVAKAQVDKWCAVAGGIAVSPPADPEAAPRVAVSVPAVEVAEAR